MPLEPGIYRSDLEGHLFALKHPLQVTCIVCGETCVSSDHGPRQFIVAAIAFVEKHGALDGKIADSILDLIPKK